MSRIAGLLTALMALLGTFGVAAQSAAAASPADGHPYRHGVVPHRGSGGASSQAPLPWTQSNSSASTRSRHNPARAPRAATNANNLSYGGGIGGIGVTTGAPQVYLVFWGSQWGTSSTDLQGNTTLSGDPKGVAPYLQGFFRGLGNEPANQQWSGVMTQYCEGVPAATQTCPSGATHVGAPTASGALAGVWVDTSAVAPASASGKQLAQEALNAAQHFGKPGAASRNAEYFIVSPTGTNPDGYKGPFGYCAWHDYTADSTLSGGGAASTLSAAVAFTNMPYVPDVGSSCGANFVNAGSAGALDGVTIVGGHEYAETITDQFPAGGWTDSVGNENGDKCAWITPGQPGGSGNLVLPTGQFAVQTTWGNDGNSGQGACQMSHPIVGGTPPASQSLKFQGLPTQITAGSAPGTIQLVDSGGQPVNAASDITVSLSSTGSGSFSPTSVAIPTGQSSSSSFTYTDTKAESTTVTASASGYNSGTQGVTVTAGPATTLTVSPGSATIGVGGGQLFTASGTDQYGNAANVGGTGWSTTAPGSLSTTTGSSTIFTASGTGSGNVTAKLGALVASASVTVTPQAIVNGGFETGTFSGWTIGGGKPNPVVSTAQKHGGTRSALLGWTASSGEPNGDSSMQQKFTVPSAGGTLSFWVWRFTTDTIRYDWQTCELRNSAGTRLATIFKTASNTGWQKQSYSLSNWKSQSVSIWCNVHEDGWGDQTYMYADDFAIG